MKPRVLVIDDDAVLRRLMTKLLGAGGYEALTASGGEEGLKSLVPGSLPDAIVLDLSMPGMSGFEVLQRLRGDAATAHLPVLVLTGQAGSADHDRSLELGADLFMTKPFSSFELLDTIRVLLGSSHRAA